MSFPFGDMESAEIPDRFFSDATDKLFSHCIQCERDLLASDAEYVIEKAIRHYKSFNTDDTIFEHAMCIDCQVKMRESLSEISKKRIDAFLESRVNLFRRRMQLMDAHGPNTDEWLSQCIVNGVPVDDEEEYQIYCHCKGDKMLFSLMPFMISGTALDEIQELLSPETRDEIDRFMGELFGLPPELQPLLRPVLVL